MAQAGETTSRDIGQDSADVAHPGATGIMEAIRSGGKKDGLASGVREAAILLAAAERELHYRRYRRNVLGSRHGLHPRDRISLARVREIFKATNTDAEVKELFDKAYEIAERLGIEVKGRPLLTGRYQNKKSPNTVAGSSQAISSASAVSGEIAVKLIDLSETYKKTDNNRTRGFIAEYAKLD